MKRNEINIRDPFVLLHDGVYYLYGTRGPTCWGPATGFDVYTGTDLENWSDPIPCFENDGTFWADRNYWAPEVHPWQGAFYMFASFKSDKRRRGTAILRADKPEGPFVPLTDDLRAPAGEPRLLFRASEAKWATPVQHSSGISGYVTDGPFLWRDQEGGLLCLWSSFSKTGYTQGLALSESGEITGPFRQLAPLFSRDGGHGMLFRDKNGEVRLALHRPNEHLLERPVFLTVNGHKEKL